MERPGAGEMLPIASNSSAKGLGLQASASLLGICASHCVFACAAPPQVFAQWRTAVAHQQAPQPAALLRLRGGARAGGAAHAAPDQHAAGSAGHVGAGAAAALCSRWVAVDVRRGSSRGVHAAWAAVLACRWGAGLGLHISDIWEAVHAALMPVSKLP